MKEVLSLVGYPKLGQNFPEDCGDKSKMLDNTETKQIIDDRLIKLSTFLKEEGADVCYYCFPHCLQWFSNFSCCSTLWRNF